MNFLKKNFTYFLLIGTTIGVGVLALVTALQLKNFRSPSSKALTPTCKISFTINDTTPRTTELSAVNVDITTPTPAIDSATKAPVKPTTTPKNTVTPTKIVPTATQPPKATTIPTQAIGAPAGTTTSTPTSAPKALAQGATLTPTTTIKPSVTVKPTVTPTKSTAVTAIVSPTVVQPELPVSGVNFPTIAAIFLGILMLTAGVFSKQLALLFDKFTKN